jgi:YebC/PmpR family DNA-binding regulatory protein
MSGHSKWSQIKHKKGIADKKKSNTFSKIAKIIAIAARAGSDPSSNIQLQNAIDRARTANMPKDNIERAIKKASDKESNALQEVILQATGPENTAFIIEAITDNSNRTVNELRHLLSTIDCKMAPEGSLDWLFERKGIITISKPLDEEMELKLIELGLQDIQQGDERYFLIIEPASLYTVQKYIEQRHIIPESAELRSIAKNPVQVTSEEKIFHIIETIEDYDDVENVFSNLA